MKKYNIVIKAFRLICLIAGILSILVGLILLFDEFSFDVIIFFILGVMLFFLRGKIRDSFEKKIRIDEEKAIEKQRQEERAAEAIRAGKEKAELKKQAIWRDFVGTDFSKIVVLDVETTGKSPSKDEILQLSIIDGEGNELFNELIKPSHRKRWDDAVAIHAISPALVKSCNTLDFYFDQVREIIKDKILVGYNIEFDIEFLAASRLISSVNVQHIDLMKPFSEIYGDWSEYHGNFTYQSLKKCAKYYGYNWGSDKAHDSLADCKATLFCFKKMCNAE